MAIKETLVIEGVNKTERALGGVQRDLNKISLATNGLSATFNRLQVAIVAAVGAIGAFNVAGTFIGTAREVENLGIQMKFLTGSTEGGAVAMKQLIDFASTVPFQLQEIARSAPALLTVANSSEELNQILRITGDIAAATGLTFQDSALQLQRAFSGGIAAADMFRERGVKSLLGFQEGVQYTAQQTRELIMKAFQDGTTTIAGASQDMANTFDGQISMIQDNFFKFQTMVMDAGPFDMLKSIVTVVREDLNKNFSSMEQAAEDIGDGIVSAVKTIAVGGAQILDALQPVFSFVGGAVSNLMSFVGKIPPELQALGILGFLALGIKGKAIILVIAGVADEINKIFNTIMIGISDFMIKSKGVLADAAEGMGFDGYAKELRDNIAELEKEKAGFKASLDGITDIADEYSLDMPEFTPFKMEMSDFHDDMGENERAVRGYISRIDKLMEEFKKKREAALKLDPNAPLKKTTGTGEVVDTAAQKALEKERAMLATKLERLREYTMSEIELAANANRKRLEDLDAMLKAGVVSEAEHKRLRGEIAAQGVQELLKLKADQVEKEKALADEALAKQRERLEEIRDIEFQITEDVTMKIEDEYAKRQTILDNALRDGLITQQRYADLELALQKKKNKDIAEATAQSLRDSRIQRHVANGATEQEARDLAEQQELFEKDKGKFVLENTRTILRETGKMNKQAFEAYKAFSIAEAVISTYKGAARALGSFPPPFNFLAAAAVVAAGFAQVNAIRSQQYSGRKDGGIVGAGQSYLVGERGSPEVFQAKEAGRILTMQDLQGMTQNRPSQPNQAPAREPVIVNFEVQAMDSASFQETLSDNKDLIVGIVNEAVNDTGRRGITG